MSSITSFKISIPEEKVSRLKQKLALTEFPDEVVTEDPWARGVPLSEIKRLASYWEKTYDWREAEAKLNELPQHIAKIEVNNFDAYDVHFVHQQSAVKNAIPLLFLHCWPGNFAEVSKILPELLTGGKDFPAFHVVAPSLIDYGFSSASKKKGFGIHQHAETCHKLMQTLGYNKYVVQGGDIGHLVSRFMALKYGPEHCRALHTNTAVPAQPTAETHPELFSKLQITPLTDSELAALGRTSHFQKEGDGYYKEQATKPQTLGYSMTDSPVGLLAWIYEKLHDWTDNYAWTDDEVLTWVSIYYFSRPGPAAANNMYYDFEHSDPPVFVAQQAYADVPMGIAKFENDLILLPKLWSHTLGPIVYESYYESGGHFAAWERPDAIVKDLRSMFGKDGGAYGCVEGQSGYD